MKNTIAKDSTVPWAKTTKSIRMFSQTNNDRGTRDCSICGVRFVQSSRYDRYCHTCIEDNEACRHADWIVLN